MVWGLVVAFLGTLSMGLSLAEVCHVYPLSGGQYDWSCEYGFPAYRVFRGTRSFLVPHTVTNEHPIVQPRRAMPLAQHAMACSTCGGGLSGTPTWDLR